MIWGHPNVHKLFLYYDMMNRNLRQFGVLSRLIDRRINGTVLWSTLDQTVHTQETDKVRLIYKLWALYSSDGYPYHLDIYTGRDANRESLLGESVLMKIRRPIGKFKRKSTLFG